MHNESNGNRTTKTRVSHKLTRALHELMEAFNYAEDTECDRWDFAIPIKRLHKLGLSEADLRWLARKGYVEHAREVTLKGENGREFRPTGDLTFTRRTCFALTDFGIAAASNGLATRAVEANSPQVVAEGNGTANQKPVVEWCAETRKLCVNGQLVKRFKWRAINQETVLNAFQEEDWPERIDDPLPPKLEQDSKRRLSDTIKCLNRKQHRSLIHFHGDGTGEGIIWEYMESDTDERTGERIPLL